MALRLALFLLACVTLYSTTLQKGADPQQTAKCIAQCNSRCDVASAACLRNAKTKGAIESCEGGLTRCKSDCVNKACK